ncbi:MAG TPA: hypothetical protein VFA94_03730, partial [Acidimicrobiales bacterium]|nr:hypothetical protein [Acidimicrobiales bacterium]
MRRAIRSFPRFRAPSLTTAVTFAVVAVAAAFVFVQLEPRLLLRNTTPSGGDMGAHVWLPAYLRDHLLPHGRLTGWTPDWYDGFPALVFYFPLPSLMIVALSTILPYGIAFKLITVLGVVTLPVAAWAFGKLSGMRAPGPACLAVATVPFLFDRTFTIYGGNIPSTLAGEFAFSISLSLTLLFLGVFAKGLVTGKYRALAAGLLALIALCHIVPTFFALIGAALLLALRFDRQRLKWALPVFLVGGALVAFWVIPFLMRIAYTNDMGWEKLTAYRSNLVPHNDRWVALLALAGAVAALVMRRRTGTFLALLAAVSGLGFILAPQGRLWNARLLPFWVISLYLLAGVAVAELGRALGRGWDGLEVEPVAAHLDEDVGQHDHAPAPADAAPPTAPLPRAARSTAGETNAGWVTPVVALLAALWFVALPLHILDHTPVLKSAFPTNDRSFIPDWVKWNYTGYEGKASNPEYQGLISTMTTVGKERGCGRAMWEYEPELDRLGTPMALMLLPYWTHDCIQSMEGLFFESAASTPYHFLNQSELSARP